MPRPHHVDLTTSMMPACGQSRPWCEDKCTCGCPCCLLIAGVCSAGQPRFDPCAVRALSVSYFISLCVCRCARHAARCYSFIELNCARISEMVGYSVNNATRRMSGFVSPTFPPAVSSTRGAHVPRIRESYSHVKVH